MELALNQEKMVTRQQLASAHNIAFELYHTYNTLQKENKTTGLLRNLVAELHSVVWKITKHTMQYYQKILSKITEMCIIKRSKKP